MALSYIAVT